MTDVLNDTLNNEEELEEDDDDELGELEEGETAEDGQDEDMADETTEASLEASVDDLEFLHTDSDNMSFYLASKSYYQDRNYEDAIEKFQAAIEYEESMPQDLRDSEDEEGVAAEELAKEANEVVAKSLYWIGESYIKTKQTDRAIETFERLSGDFGKHYLRLAAQRRIATLKADSETVRAESESV